jgi:hypothetical protein
MWEQISDILETHSDWAVTLAGVATGLVCYMIVRTWMSFWAYLSRPWVPRRRRNVITFMIGRLLFRGTADTLLHMDAMRNTPDDERRRVGPEKRAAFRRRDSVVEIMVVTPDLKQNMPERAFVVDRSTTGLGIMIERDYPIGAMLAIRPSSAPETVPWVEVEVRSCTPHDHAFRLGCQFVVVPEWGILLQFG